VNAILVSHKQRLCVIDMGSELWWSTRRWKFLRMLCPWPADDNWHCQVWIQADWIECQVVTGIWWVLSGVFGFGSKVVSWVRHTSPGCHGQAIHRDHQQRFRKFQPRTEGLPELEGEHLLSMFMYLTGRTVRHKSIVTGSKEDSIGHGEDDDGLPVWCKNC